MKPEHYMVTALPIGGGERVTGWLWQKKPHTDKYLLKCFPQDDDEDVDHVVDPATIERMKEPVKRERTSVGDYRCPNCNAAFIEGAGITPFCGNCGQALEWHEGEGT